MRAGDCVSSHYFFRSEIRSPELLPAVIMHNKNYYLFFVLFQYKLNVKRNIKFIHKLATLEKKQVRPRYKLSTSTLKTHAV